MLPRSNFGLDKKYFPCQIYVLKSYEKSCFFKRNFIPIQASCDKQKLVKILSKNHHWAEQFKDWDHRNDQQCFKWMPTFLFELCFPLSFNTAHTFLFIYIFIFIVLPFASYLACSGCRCENGLLRLKSLLIYFINVHPNRKLEIAEVMQVNKMRSIKWTCSSTSFPRSRYSVREEEGPWKRGSLLIWLWSQMCCNGTLLNWNFKKFY